MTQQLGSLGRYLAAVTKFFVITYGVTSVEGYFPTAIQRIWSPAPLTTALLRKHRNDQYPCDHVGIAEGLRTNIRFSGTRALGETTDSLSSSGSPPNTNPVVFASNRGDARGAALLLENVSVYRGPNQVIKGIDWRVEPRTKWALVGSNGAGKSSLLKAIADEVPFDGKIVIGAKEQVGYLQQTAVAGSQRTIYEEATAGMIQINEARRAMEEAEEVGDLLGLEKAVAHFEAVGGYKQDQKVANVLKGLGFTDFNMRCDQLSGGWQMRVAFARLLLSEPSLCLMDEPSNHLDAAAKKWLAKYLADYSGEGSMVLVTHDVELLQSMDHIAEIIPGAGKLQIYKSCTYDQYLELKQQRAAAAITAYERNNEKAAKLQSFVDRFGASATKASAAQSRVKMIERMERDGLLDAPPDELTVKRFKPRLTLPRPPKAVGNVLLSLIDASVGYGEKVLVSGVNLDITKGMKLLIRGPNGAGKSTVLHTLRGNLPLMGGQRKENDALRLGMFTQDLAQELDPNSRAVDLATEYAREGRDGDVTVSDQSARNVMGGLGLPGDKALRRLADLSGGEKARVALAMFALKPSNVYLLDEASNHLDIECVEALSEALSNWGHGDGALVVVSHDQTFCSKIDFTHVATVSNGSFVLEERSARKSDWVIETLGSSSTDQTQIAPSPFTDSSKIDPKLRKQAYNAPKRIAKLEKLIEEAETKISTIDDEMLKVGNDVAKLVDLTKKKESMQANIIEYMVEWEQLEELLAQVS